MPERTDYWGIPSNWRPDLIVYSVMFLAAIILLVRFYQQGRLWWQVGRSEKRWDKIQIRFGRLINYAIVQTRILSQRYPGLMHIGLAWGFFVFFLGTALATIDSHFIKFLVGNPYLIYKFILDIFTIFFLFGAVLAGYRRFIQKPSRLTLDTRFTLSLILISLIVLAGLTIESLRLAIVQPAWALWSPVGWLVAQIWIASGATQQTLLIIHEGTWLFHLLLAGFTVAILPVGTLWHTLTGPVNIFFSEIDRPTGQLKPVAETAKNEPIYVKSLSDLTWKQLMEGNACTECGRCQDVCPAYAAGTPLSPKQFVLSI